MSKKPVNIRLCKESPIECHEQMVRISMGDSDGGDGGTLKHTTYSVICAILTAIYSVFLHHITIISQTV